MAGFITGKIVMNFLFNSIQMKIYFLQIAVSVYRMACGYTRMVVLMMKNWMNIDLIMRVKNREVFLLT